MENVQPKTQDDEEAILRANSTKYGLGASIWSENLEKARVKGRNMLAINYSKERYISYSQYVPCMEYVPIHLPYMYDLW